jgi:hypothetical protein
LPSVLLDIGMHVVVAEAHGYLSETRNLQVMGGEDVVLMMSLPPVPGAPGTLPAVSLPSASEPGPSIVAVSSPANAQEAQGRADDGPKRPLYKNAWLWSGVGVAVVAAVVVASVVAANNNGDKSKVGEPSASGNSAGYVFHGLWGSL